MKPYIQFYIEKQCEMYGRNPKNFSKINELIPSADIRTIAKAESNTFGLQKTRTVLFVEGKTRLLD